MVTIERRGPHLVLPLLLIVAGLIALLANFGLLAYGFWDRLFQLWPLILVVVGLEILTRGERATPSARWGAFGMVLVLVAGATIYAVGPWLPTSGGALKGTSSAPLAGVSSANLNLSYGAGAITLTSADTGQDLYQASYSSTGVAPSRTFTVDGDTLTVNIKNNFAWLGQNGDRLDLKLNQSIPWAVTVNTGGGANTIDLRTVNLRSLAVNAAAGRVTLQVGAPSSSVPITFSGVSQNVHLSAPAGTLFSVHASGIASNVTLPDGTRLSGAFSDRSWQSAGYPGSAGSYSIELSGVAQNLTLEVPQS
jgi:hypothetical protein